MDCRRKKENRRAFLLSFVFSFLILSIFTMGMLLWLNGRNVPPPAAPPSEKSSAKADLLLFITDQNHHLFRCALLVKKPSDTKIYAGVLPPSLLFSDGSSLSSLFAQKGPLEVLKRINKELGVNLFSRYAAVDFAAVKALCEKVGYIECLLPQNESILLGEHAVLLQQGRQKLSPALFWELLQSDSFAEKEPSALLLDAFLQKFLLLKDTQKADCWHLFLNRAFTSLTAFDTENYLQALTPPQNIKNPVQTVSFFWQKESPQFTWETAERMRTAFAS